MLSFALVSVCQLESYVMTIYDNTYDTYDSYDIEIISL